jgi:hypothetical protein
MIRNVFHIYFTKGAWRIWTYLLLLELAIIMYLKG